jgi:hypothetical protein
MLVEHIIQETYINAVGNDDKNLAIKNKYKDQVWDILQKSYASIGGIRGSGFSSPEEMVDQIPMWKIGVRGNTVHTAILYKDGSGRKSVAMGSDGSIEAQWFVDDIVKYEMRRSYGEKSKAALGKVMKTIPWDILQNYVISPDRVEEMLPDDYVIPIFSVADEDLPTDAVVTLSRYPHLKDYGYIRDIGGIMTFKVMIGSPGKSIE